MAGQVLISSVDSAANALPGRAAPPGLVNVIHRLASDRPLSSACLDLVLDQSMANNSYWQSEWLQEICRKPAIAILEPCNRCRCRYCLRD